MTSIQNISGASSLSYAAPVSANPFESIDKHQSAERVASEFESVFTSIMLKEMRKTLEPGSMFGEDSSDIYGGMFDQFLGQHMSNAGGIGLASMVRQALARSAAAEQSSGSVQSLGKVSAEIPAVAN